MKKILVPVAEGGLDESTLNFAKEMSAGLGAHVLLITVLPYSDTLSHPQLAHFVGVEGKAFMDVSEEIIKGAQKQMTDVGITNVSTAILKGDPASAIIDAAENEKCDLILIHTHGMGLAKRFTVGSVTNTIVHHANVPVLVIK